MRIYQGIIFVKNLRDFLKQIPDGCALINADYVLSLETVRFAVEKALKSWEEGKRVSKSISMEILLHFSATRQINQAVKAGIREGENRVVVVDLNECIEILRKLGFKERDVVDGGEEKLRRIAEFYGIGNKEIEVTGWEKIEMIVRERIALFSISK